MKKLVLLAIVASCLIFSSSTAFACGQSLGQIVYGPALYNDFRPLTTEIGVSRIIIRNIDPTKSLILVSVNFYNPDGNLVKEFLSEPEVIDPLASVSFIANLTTMEELLYHMDAGRPSFIVKWRAAERVKAPIIEVARILITPGESGTVKGFDYTPGTVIRQRTY